MFYQWKNFIHTTTNYFVKTTIECGAACNSYWDQCDLFVFQESKKRCHIGVSEQNNNYLNGIGGEWPVHLSIGNITKNFFTQPQIQTTTCGPILEQIFLNSWFNFSLLSDKLINSLESTYLELTYVKEEVYWEKFIYKTFALPSPADFLDCSFICKNVHKEQDCSIFVFEVQIHIYLIISMII